VRHLIPALVVTLALFSTAHAAPAKTSPFGTKAFGDGGGYKHPDADVGQYLEIKPEKPAELDPKRPPIPAKVAPVIKPVEGSPSRPRPRPFAPADAVQEAPARDAAAAPKAPAAEDAPLDSASEDARSDYESRLLGVEPAPRRPELADPAARVSAEAIPAASMGEGMLFVSLELDAQEAGSLRDAVAGLGASAAFRPDARFQPLPGPAGSVRISGWLPAARLGDAIARPGVRRVEVERGSRPAGDQRVAGSYLLTLRVADVSRPEESVAETVRELTADSGFKLERVFGFETLPDGGKTALVSGTLPVSRLSRALGMRGILRIASSFPEASLAAPAVSSSPAEKAPAKKAGFLAFVMSRGLWLVLLTILIALPTVGKMLGAALSVFVPYR